VVRANRIYTEGYMSLVTATFTESVKAGIYIFQQCLGCYDLCYDTSKAKTSSRQLHAACSSYLSRTFPPTRAAHQASPLLTRLCAYTALNTRRTALLRKSTLQKIERCFANPLHQNCRSKSFFFGCLRHSPRITTTQQVVSS